MALMVGSSVIMPGGAPLAGHGPGGGFAEVLLCAAVAMVVLRIEVQRRAGLEAAGGSWPLAWSADRAKRLLKENVAETALLLSCATLAVMLRSRGDTSAHQSDAQWEQIKSSWPVLITADTLLSLQSMLRLVAFLAAMLRVSDAGAAAPLAEGAAALWLFGGIARMAVFARTDAYVLDGPLGGALPTAFEAAALPTLLALGSRALRRSWLPLTLAVAAVLAYAQCNHLSLAEADDRTSDILYSSAECFETLAAFVYLARAALVEGAVQSPGAGFVHLLMPVQQALGAYYWLEAFSGSHDLVGAGRPFDVLHIGTVAGLGAYLAAGALFLADRLDPERSVTV